jgi:hypothetical protein
MSDNMRTPGVFVFAKTRSTTVLQTMGLLMDQLFFQRDQALGEFVLAGDAFFDTDQEPRYMHRGALDFSQEATT